MDGLRGKRAIKKEPAEKSLARYVSHMIKAKGLSARKVAERSGGRITAGYVTGLMIGSADNPSVDKLKALASGLGVDRYELFDVAWGPSETISQRAQGSERLQTLEFLDLMKKVAVSTPLMKILEKAVRLSPEELEAVLKSVNRFIDVKRQSKRTRKRG